jgi:hypothetical protein
MNSPVGWVLAMLGIWAMPLLIVAVDLTLFLAPALMIAALYGLVRRLLPRTSFSLRSLSSWTVAIALLIGAYVALQIIVVGQFPPPGVIVQPVDETRSVPMAVYALALAGSVLSAFVLTYLVRRGIAQINANTV